MSTSSSSAAASPETRPRSAQRGASVLLLETETFGYGGSGRNVGFVNIGLWLTLHDVVAQMGGPASLKLVGLLADALKLSSARKSTKS